MTTQTGRRKTNMPRPPDLMRKGGGHKDRTKYDRKRLPKPGN